MDQYGVGVGRWFRHSVVPSNGNVRQMLVCLQWIAQGCAVDGGHLENIFGKPSFSSSDAAFSNDCNAQVI